MAMHREIRAFMSEIVDYAGLFPPARLELDPAIRNFARYRRGEEAFLLGAFVCPATRLSDLAPYAAELFADDPPFPFSVLTSPAEDADSYRAAVRDSATQAAAFRAAHPGLVAVRAYESRLPEDVARAADVDALSETIRDAVRMLTEAAPGVRTLVFEAALGDAWRERTALVADALSRVGEAYEDGPKIGFKLRCGGLDATAFPSVEQVAHTLATCRDRRVPFKATAGLHHPYRHRVAALDARAHGFVNVFGAGILGYVHSLDESALRVILGDENPVHFAFTDGEFRWTDLAARVEQIREARADAVLSFGSCSVDEPMDDLKILGLL